MKERPILFSAPMVRAILAGTKTQTRRDAKFIFHSNGDRPLLQTCPYGHRSDRIWVRETHFINDFRGAKVPEAERADCEILYRATDEKIIANFEDDDGLVWKPSIHMPRWASRILLEITDIRVERLKDISEADAEAEGIETVEVSETDFRYVNYLWRTDRTLSDKEATSGSPVVSYATLWESINGPCSWDANPWVWVIEFKRIEVQA